MKVALDAVDRRLVNRLQEDLPLQSRPFAGIAEELGLSESEVLERLQRLLDEGILTRFGPFFDAAAMGGAFCLCAMAVPEERFDAVAEQVNAWPEVAHNYERDHSLNMWFVLAAESLDEIEAVATAIEQQSALPVWRFPKLQEFFIGFRVSA